MLRFDKPGKKYDHKAYRRHPRNATGRDPRTPTQSIDKKRKRRDTKDYPNPTRDPAMLLQPYAEFVSGQHRALRSCIECIASEQLRPCGRQDHG